MLTHFDMAADLRHAALMGDLVGVRRSATLLADLERPPDLGPEHQPRLIPLARAARAAGLARSSEEAARATADVARACADCHVAAGVGLEELLSLEPRPGVAPASAHAPALGPASSLLWSGVAAPSERHWRAGLEALEAAGPIDAEARRGLPPEYVVEIERRIARLTEEADRATAPDERSRLLGEIWSACADCHSIT
jgi:cytochrome c553